MKFKLFENDNVKILGSTDYNYFFDKNCGLFLRWGAKKEDDPLFSPFGPELLDIEVTTSCQGVPGIGSSSPSVCSFCYKSNTPKGKNMSLETFKHIIDSFPHVVGQDGKKHFVLGQIAFGADSEATSNPELFDMMDHARSLGIIPNITVANISDETADKLSSRCGAVACSRYANKDVCYDSVKRLTDRGMTQVNIHHMICSENYDQIMETLNDRLTDPRLANLNAIVLLSLKQKGRGERYSRLDQERFNEIVSFALDHRIGIGFDSCSAPKFLEAVKEHPDRDQFEQLVEPCESLLFSFYVNVDGKYTPCSFCENKLLDYNDGISVIGKDFLQEVWFSPEANRWRENILGRKDKGDLTCPVYEV